MKKYYFTIFIIIFISFSPAAYSKIILELKCAEHSYFINPQIGDTTKPAIETWQLSIGNSYLVTITGEGGYQENSVDFPGIICAYYDETGYNYRIAPPQSQFTFQAGKAWFAAFVVDHNGLHNVWGTYFITLEKATATSTSAPQASKSFGLSQNFPNPFNNSTKINYRVDTPCQVQIEIFNMSGDLVRVLLNEAKSPGEYSTVWDGLDKEKNSVASGQYFYRLKMDGLVKIKKMVFLK